MKAITLHQPYATLWVREFKLYETRSWKTDYRGEMAIHGAKRNPASVLDTLPEYVVKEMRQLLPWEVLEELPTGVVVGKGELVACHFIEEDFLATLEPLQLILGDYTLGRYAWEFRNVVEFSKPVPARGQQGLWNWKNEQ